jgi:L-serine dehydratase
MGPGRAAKLFREAYPEADGFRAVLYGSLAKTGKGHMTDAVLRQSFAPLPSEIIFDMDTPEEDLPHPCTMELFAYRDGAQVGFWRVMSVGGGAIRVLGSEYHEAPEVYAENSFAEIAAYCRERGIRIWQYVQEKEGPQIWPFLDEIWAVMKDSIRKGPFGDGACCRAGSKSSARPPIYIIQYHMDESAETKENRIVCSYAFAVSEHSAGNGIVVTAPTCGASGVVPAVLYYTQQKRGFTDTEVLHALATAGIIGNLIKTITPRSPVPECGCQAEIGSAVLDGLTRIGGSSTRCALSRSITPRRLRMEQHASAFTLRSDRGPRADPCIVRNAVRRLRAMNALSLANFLTDTRKISFDMGRPHHVRDRLRTIPAITAKLGGRPLQRAISLGPDA